MAVSAGDAALPDAIERLAAARDRAQIVRRLRAHGCDAVGCDGLVLMLREADQLRIVLAAASCPTPAAAGAAMSAAVLIRDAGIARLAMTQRRCLLIPDAAASELLPEGATRTAPMRALAVMPLGVSIPAGVPSGVLAALWNAPHPPAGSVERLRLLFHAAAGALDAARLADALPHLAFVLHPDGGATPLGGRWEPYGIAAGGGRIGRAWLRRALHPDERRPVLRAWRDARAARRPIELDHRLRHRDGGYRWFRTRAEPMPDADGTVAGWAGSAAETGAPMEAHGSRPAHGPADRTGTEARLAKAERIEAVGQLTSGVAHDFNNLLTVIIGNIGFLEAALAVPGAGDAVASDPRTPARLQAIRQAAERGADLTRQLLAFARRQRLEPRPTDLNAVVAELRGLLPAAIGGGISVEVALQDGLWPALVDRTQIERMILNLAMNAHDAVSVGDAILVGTRNRPVGAVEAEALGLGGAGDFVEIAVTDQGSGMSSAVLARAFEPFFTTKPPGLGSGLGLAQVYGFARQSGGIVTLRSAPGEGTSAAILLPRAAIAADPPPPSPSPPGQPAPPRPPALPAGLIPELAHRPVTVAVAEPLVLLVDDDRAVREVTSTIVAEAGYRVIEAASGPDALERLSQNGPVDLMVTDYAMPGMNGHELARAARTRQIDLKVLFVTGYADLTGLGDVADSDILLKPFRGARLIEKITGALRA